MIDLFNEAWKCIRDSLPCCPSRNESNDGQEPISLSCPLSNNCNCSYCWFTSKPKHSPTERGDPAHHEPMAPPGLQVISRNEKETVGDHLNKELEKTNSRNHKTGPGAKSSPDTIPTSSSSGSLSPQEKEKKNQAHSPLSQFSIVPLIPLKIGKFYFSFTNASFFLLLSLSFVLFSISLVTKKGVGKSVSNAFQSLLELIYDFVPNLVNEQIGGLSGNVKQEFFPCISVTFTFSLFRNLQGMIPYSFTVTSHFIVTLGLSFSLFIGITIVGFLKNGLHFLSFSLPAGVPLPLAPFLVLLELIPHSFRALSLGIRLFANMMAGHSLVKILSGFAWTMLCMNDLFYFIGSTVPFFIVLALTGLELGVAILQAYVFTILMCIYLNDAINLH